MNLVDVKNALETIVRLNPGLSEDKLVVLLKAANWEEGSIKDALVVFTTITQEIRLPHVDNENLLTQKVNLPHVDNENLLEEGKKNIGEKVTTIVQDKQTEVLNAQQPIKSSSIWPFTKQVSKEPTPPVIKNTPVPVSEHLPEGLPLKAFDSSEHVWTFSEYKEKFHGGVSSSLPTQTKTEVLKEKIVSVPIPKVVPIVKQQPVSIQKEMILSKKEVDISEPLTGSDLSLVVVVSFLFLVIILLLGYMYSNGRLFL